MTRQAPETFEQFAERMKVILDGVPPDNTMDGYSACAAGARNFVVEAFAFYAKHHGITGFMASWAMNSAYAKILRIDGPFQVTIAENAMFPRHNVEQAGTEFLQDDGVRRWLKAEATKRLADPEDGAHPDVLAHWRRLAAIDVPPVDESLS